MSQLSVLDEILDRRPKPQRSPLELVDEVLEGGAERLQQIRAADADAQAERLRSNPATFANELSGIVGGGVNAAARVAGPLVRAGEAVGIAPAGSADGLVRQSQALSEAQRRNVDESGMSAPRAWLNRQIPGVASSIAQAGVLGATGGTAALTAGFGLGEANEALTEAKDAGLVGDQALNYAAKQGTLEAGIMLAGQGLGKAIPGLAGLEGVFTQQQIPQKLSRELVKQMGVRTASELTEEELTSILQTINRAASLPGAENAANWTDENGDVWNSPMMQVIRDTAGQTLLTMGLVEAPGVTSAALEARRSMADRLSSEQPAGNLAATSEQPATGLLADLIAQGDPANAGVESGAAGPTPVDNLVERKRAADEAEVRERLRRMLSEPEIGPESTPAAETATEASVSSPDPVRPAESEFEPLSGAQRNELLQEFSSLDDADLEQQVDALIQQAPQFAEEIELLGRESRDIRAETDRVSQEEPLIAEFGRRRLGKRPDRVDASPDAGNVSPELQNVDTSAEVPTNRNTGEQSSVVYDFLNDPAVTERLRRIVVAQGHSVHDAEDIVQSVLSSVWDKEDKSPGYFQPETLENYVARAVTNRSRGQKRTIGRRREQQVDAPDVADPSIEGLPPDVIAASRESAESTPVESAQTAPNLSETPNSSPEPAGSLRSETEPPREGDTRVDEYGLAQVYRLIDPNSVSFTEPTSDVENHPSVAEYARLASEGSVPPPIEVVLNEDSGKPVTVNRRRVMAAQRAGTLVPAWVDEKADAILQPKKKLGKTQADPAAVSPETVPEPSAQAAPAEQVASVLRSTPRGERFYLDQVRAQLPELSREQVDAALRELEASQEIVLYPLDNPRERTPERDAGGLPNTAGVVRQIGYTQPSLRRSAAPETGSRPGGRQAQGTGNRPVEVPEVTQPEPQAFKSNYRRRLSSPGERYVQERQSSIAQSLEARDKVEGHLKGAQAELSKISRRSTKKRRDLERIIDDRRREIQRINERIDDASDEQRIATIEGALETADSELRFNAGMAELSAIQVKQANRKEAAERRETRNRTYIEAHQQDANKADKERTRYQQNVQAEFVKLMRERHGDVLNGDEIFYGAERAADSFGIDSKRTPEQVVDDEFQTKMDARKNNATMLPRTPHLSNEEIKPFQDELNAAVDKPDWFERDKEIRKRLLAADEAARKRQQAEATEKARQKAEEQAVVDRELAQEQFDKRKAAAGEKRYWLQLADRAKKLKTQKKVQQKIGEGDDTKSVTGEALNDTWFTYKDDDGDYPLVHRATGLSAGTATTLNNAKQLALMFEDAGYDFSRLTPENHKHLLAQPEFKGIPGLKKAWEFGRLSEASDDQRKTMLSTVQKPDVGVKADIELDAADLIPPGQSSPPSRLKDLAREVPEFGYNPVFTVNDQRKLVFKDGFKFEFEPEFFGLDSLLVEPGQTVALNLEDVGIKRPDAETVVKHVLGREFDVKKRPKKGQMALTRLGPGERDTVVLSGSDENWTVTRGGETADGQRAQQMLDGIPWRFKEQVEKNDAAANQSVDGNKMVTPEPQDNTGNVTEQRSAIGQKTGAAADAATAEFKAALKEVGKQIGKAARGETPGMGGAFSDEMFNAVVAAVKAGVKAGITNFADLVVRAAEELGEATVRDAGRLFEMSWEIVGETNKSLDKPGSVAEILDRSTDTTGQNPDTVSDETPEETGSESENRPESGQALPTDTLSADEPDDNLTSIKKAVVNELREKRGVAELETAPPQSREQWLKQAADRLRSDPDWTNRLVMEVNAEPRNLSDEEIAGLQLHYRRLNNEFEKADAALEAAQQSGIPEEIARAQTASDLISQQMLETEAATKAAGTEWGRAGVARQITLGQDYSLGNLTRKARAAKGGQPLTAEESAEVRRLAAQVADLQQQLDVLQNQAAEREKNARIDESIQKDVKEAAKASKRKARKAAARKKVDDAWDAFGKLATGRLYSNPVDPDLIAAAGKIVAAYAELGVVTFADFMSRARKKLGTDRADKARDAFQAAWDEAQANGEIATPEIDPDDLAALGRLARQIQRGLVEDGITEREAVVDGVHESLAELFPGLTRRQTMDALSGYGQYSPLSKYETDVIIRDINGQLQQLAKLEDMQQGQAPAKTGRERRTPSEEERRLIQQVNEAKKRGGFQVTDPAAQLRTALDAAKKAVQNRIADIEEELRTGEPIVRGRTELIPDAELTKLRERRDALLVEHRKQFPKAPQTDAQKLAAAERAVDKAIADLERQLATGDVAPKKRLGKTLSSPTLDAKRARLEALRAQRQELRDLANPKLTPEERALKAYKRSLEERRADYLDRAERGDFQKQPRKGVTLDKEAQDLKFQLEQAKAEFNAKAEQWRRDQRTGAERTIDGVKQSLYASRAILTSVDFSAVFRQGGMAAFSHPILAAKAVPEMLRAFVNKRGEFDAAEGLRNRPNANLYEKAKLAIAVTEGSLTKQEEAFMGDWASHIPLVAASERAYVTFLNRIRADVFDSLVETLGRGGQVTDAEAKSIARFVNMATGRADLGRLNSAAAGFATVFFAPRYVASRFQLLAEPIRQATISKDSLRVKKLVAAEYSRYLAGVATFYGLVALAGMIMGGDDEDQPQFEFDPRSSDFGKVRLGETRIDPLSGISQMTVFLNRVLRGETKRADGTIAPLRGDDVKFGQPDTGDVIWRFIRSKFSPAIGSAVDLASGETVVGEPVTPGSVAVNAVIPLSFRDIDETMRAQGFVKGTALSLLSLLGLGVSTYGDETRFRDLTPEEQDAEFKKYLKSMRYDDGQPGFSRLLSDEQRQQVDQTRQRKLGKMVQDTVISSGIPEPQKGETADEYGDRLAERQAKLVEQQQWIEQHADDPEVQDAIRQAVRSKSYRDLMDREFKGERNTLTRPRRLGKTADVYRLQVEAYNERRRIGQKLKDSLK